MHSPDSDTKPFEKGVDTHIAHEDNTNQAPLPGGVPDESDTGKTAAPDAGWENAGGAYGGLRIRKGEEEEHRPPPADTAPPTPV